MSADNRPVSTECTGTDTAAAMASGAAGGAESALSAAGAAAASGVAPLAEGVDRMKKLASMLIGAGLLICVVTLFFEGGLDRFGFAYLWGFAFLWTVVLGCLFFVALQHVTHAVWSVVVRRIAEMFAAPIGVVALLFLPVALFALLPGSFSVFPWSDPGVVTGDALLEGKRPYLNVPFFIARAALFFVIWTLFTNFFVKRSLLQDEGVGGEAATKAMRRWSAPFIVIFALTITFAAFDWLMSLEPHWFSTIFGVYIFAGMTLVGLAVITIAVVWMRAKGRLGDRIVTDEHLYSLGALTFAFTCFWAYIGFSQFMLIWYGNIPEETVYYMHRIDNGWLGISLLVVALRFVLPFFLLLSRDAKMNPKLLVTTSVVVIVGQFVDLYWLIMPQAHSAAPRLGWQDFGPPLIAIGVLIFCMARFLKRHRTMAVGDPLFKESCEFYL